MRSDPTAWTRRRFLGLGAALAAGAAVGACSADRGSTPDRPERDDAPFAGTYLDPPFEKPDVAFTDHDGNPFPFREATQGKLSILFFGYTNCPDVCPVYLQTMASALDAIGSGPGSRPQVLFVGTDVARDTPEVMKAYLGNIDQSFLGLTGPETEIANALTALKLPPVVIGEPDAEGNYEVGHPSHVIAFTADDVSHRIYNSTGVRQQEWVRDLPRLDQGVWK